MLLKKAYYADYIYYNSSIKERSWLLTEGDIIKGITNVTPEKDYEQIVFENSGIFPALINTHTHLPMVYFRGLADDLPLMEWLQKHIWPAENKWLSEEFIVDATKLAIAEMIKSGTGTANDMYFYLDTMADVISNAGVRGVLGSGIIDIPTKFAKNTDEYISRAEASILRYKGNPLIDITLCPHALYTVSTDTYKRCVEVAEKYDVAVHTHLAETEWEVNEILSKHGKTPAALMDSIGMFDCKSIFAHCVHLTDNEIALMGKKNINISHCIDSNLKLASGLAPIKKLQDAGANITIGTDGAASNNDINLLSEMSTVAKFHKAFSNDPTAFDSKTVLSCATVNAAKALNKNDIGELAKGKKADFFVLSFDDVHMQPVYNPLSHLIYSAQKSDITDMFVAGKQLMSKGKLLTLDEDEIKAKSKYWSKKIKG